MIQATTDRAASEGDHPGGGADVPKILWCCHVRGPDDVHAAPDYETALKWSDTVNSWNWRGLGGKIKPPASYDDCLLKASPAIWPWSAESHAENMPDSIAGFTIPQKPSGAEPTPPG